MIAAVARLDVRPLLVGGFALFAILVLWTQAQPFASLSDYGVLDDPTQSNALRRNLTLLILALALWLVWRGGQSGRLWETISPGLVAIFAWFALTALVSRAPGLALNRLALAGIVIAIAVCLPLLFARLGDFVVLLGVAASTAIVLSFLGALFMPDLAIHSIRDTVEQGLAGDWRGMFKHKNDLAPMAIHFCLVGILLWQFDRRLWGAMVVAGALALLMLSGGKSAALLLMPTLAGAAVIVHVRAGIAMLVAIALVGGLAMLTLGSVAFPAIGAIAAHLPDPTFTGRADIWQLALAAIEQRPLTGYGYNIFWDTGAAYSVAASGDTAAQVSHAHNGYLEVALSAGIPGLALVLAWAGLAPLRQIASIKQRTLDRAEQAFLFYLVAAWLFTLLISSLEAVLFNRGDSIWFTGLLAMVCLRLWSRSALMP
ncbi:O-antigen ligase family protein [Devosia sp. SL43]|uniref:O-antigen ligase family protein n=1 Tax=Devosia sp. SL43 TaxID=2806348 RepID=UPI001F20E8FD|nr:O-antigen ligase [Devosia sp. SL43]UJW84814.1 O-antigen ligase family protein [Devosia sp. SL43]